MLSNGGLRNTMIRNQHRGPFNRMLPTRVASAAVNRGVSFLVEGLSVDVPQDLLRRFPESKLATLASERKKGFSHTNDDEPIEIGIDLLHFRYMVDFMRNGEVTLGPRDIVDKQSLMKTLDTFGFQNAYDTRVMNYASLSTTAMYATKHLCILNAEHQSRSAAVQDEYGTTATAQEKVKQMYKTHCLTAARFLFFQYWKTNNIVIKVPMPAEDEFCPDPLWDSLEVIRICFYSNGDESYRDLHTELMFESCKKDSELEMYHQECLRLYGLEYMTIQGSATFEGQITVLLKRLSNLTH